MTIESIDWLENWPWDELHGNPNLPHRLEPNSQATFKYMPKLGWGRLPKSEPVVGYVSVRLGNDKNIVERVWRDEPPGPLLQWYYRYVRSHPSPP